MTTIGLITEDVNQIARELLMAMIACKQSQMLYLYKMDPLITVSTYAEMVL